MGLSIRARVDAKGQLVQCGLPLRLLDLPASRLLEAYGAGRPTPGSGSAAALNGVLGGELIASAAKITKKHSPYPKNKSESEYVLKLVSARTPVLRELVQRDSDVFEQVVAEQIKARKAATANERRRHREKCRRKLKDATDIVLSICKECLAVARLGLIMMDVGFEPARGDPAVGVSNALAGVIGAFSAAMVNLKTARRSKWASKKFPEFQAVYVDMLEVQASLLQKVTGLNKEAEDYLFPEQLKLF